MNEIATFTSRFSSLPETVSGDFWFTSPTHPLFVDSWSPFYFYGNDKRDDDLSCSKGLEENECNKDEKDKFLIILVHTTYKL